MKEMYLKVEVEQNCGDWVDVFYRQGRYFTCSKDDKSLVDIEDAEVKGAENLYKALIYIIHSDSVDLKGAFGGRCGICDIIRDFTPKEIIQRVEKMNVHVPAQGDIYASRKSGNKVAVLSYNEETRRVRFMGGSYVTNGSVEDFDKMFSFTGCNYQGIDSIANELYSEEGDNT